MISKAEKKKLLELVSTMIGQYEKRRINEYPEQFISDCALESDKTGQPLLPCNPLKKGECPDASNFDPDDGVFRDRPWVNTFSKDPTTTQLVRCIPRKYYGAAEGEQPVSTKTLLYRLFDSVTKMEDEWARNEELVKAQLPADVGYVGPDQLVHPVKVKGPDPAIKVADINTEFTDRIEGDAVNISSCEAAKTSAQCDMRRRSGFGKMSNRCFWTPHARHLKAAPSAKLILDPSTKRYTNDNDDEGTPLTDLDRGTVAKELFSRSARCIPRKKIPFKFRDMTAEDQEALATGQSFKEAKVDSDGNLLPAPDGRFKDSGVGINKQIPDIELTDEYGNTRQVPILFRTKKGKKELDGEKTVRKIDINGSSSNVEKTFKRFMKLSDKYLPVILQTKLDKYYKRYLDLKASYEKLYGGSDSDNSWIQMAEYSGESVPDMRKALAHIVKGMLKSNYPFTDDEVKLLLQAGESYEAGKPLGYFEKKEGADLTKCTDLVKDIISTNYPINISTGATSTRRKDITDGHTINPQNIDDRYKMYKSKSDFEAWDEQPMTETDLEANTQSAVCMYTNINPIRRVFMKNKVGRVEAYKQLAEGSVTTPGRSDKSKFGRGFTTTGSTPATYTTTNKVQKSLLEAMKDLPKDDILQAGGGGVEPAWGSEMYRQMAQLVRMPYKQYAAELSKANDVTSPDSYGSQFLALAAANYLFGINKGKYISTSKYIDQNKNRTAAQNIIHDVVLYRPPGVRKAAIEFLTDEERAAMFTGKPDKLSFIPGPTSKQKADYPTSCNTRADYSPNCDPTYMNQVRFEKPSGLTTKPPDFTTDGVQLRQDVIRMRPIYDFDTTIDVNVTIDTFAKYTAQEEIENAVDGPAKDQALKKYIVELGDDAKITALHNAAKAVYDKLDATLATAKKKELHKRFDTAVLTNLQSGMLKIGAYYAACLIDHCRLTGKKMDLADKWKSEWDNGADGSKIAKLQYLDIPSNLDQRKVNLVT